MVIETTLEVVTSIMAATEEVAHLGVREGQDEQGTRPIANQQLHIPNFRPTLPQ